MAARHEEGLVRVEVGFNRGQLLVARLSKKSLESLTKAARKGESWIELDVEDGQVSLDASQITYIRSDFEESRIGFGGG